MAFRLYLASCMLPILVIVHLWAAPFTKVEESFNIQATHDFLTYGLPITNGPDKIKGFFDHMKFPGAVPRTFTGAMVLSGIATQFSRAFGSDLPHKQMVGMHLHAARSTNMLTRVQSDRCSAV
jgi:alpha-1,6-mannosyltransferase